MSGRAKRESHSQPQPQQNGRQPEPQHPPPPAEAYGWFEPALGDGDPPPLAYVGRVFCLLDYLISEAQEHNESPTWVTYGLAEVARQAAMTGDWSPLGVMLTGLETLIDPQYRENWPLAEMTMPRQAAPQESEAEGPEEEEPAVREQSL